MLARLRQLYECAVIRKAWLTLTISVSLIVSCGMLLTQLRLDASADSLLLENDSELLYYRGVKERYGADDFLVIAYTPRHELFTRRSLLRLQALRDELAGVDGVERVLTLLDAPLFKSPPVALSELSQITRTLLTPGVDYRLAREELTNSPIYKELLISEDGLTTALIVFLRSDAHFEALLRKRERLRALTEDGQPQAEQRQELKKTEGQLRARKAVENARSEQRVRAVREVIAQNRQQSQIHLGGVSMIISDMIEYIRDDLRVFGGALLIFFLLSLSVIFARPRWVFIPIACCATAALLSGGALALLDWHITVVSSNFVPLLLIITMSIVIHLCIYYQDHRRKRPQLDHRQSIRETTRFMRTPCLYSVLTTAVAFFSLMVSGLRPVIDFGHIMSLGIALGLLTCFVLFPVLLTLLPKEKPLPIGKSLSMRITAACAKLVKERHLAILYLAAALAIVSLVGATRLEVENRFIDYFRSDTEIHQGMLVIDRQLGGTTPMDLILNAPQSYLDEAEAMQEESELDYLSMAGVELEVSNYWLQASRFEQIKRVHRYLEGQKEIGKVMSLAMLIETLEQISEKPLGDLESFFLRTFMPEDIRPVLLDPYVSEDGNQLRISMRVIDSDHGLSRKELIERLNKGLNERLGYSRDDYRLSGLMVLYNNTLQSLYESQILTLGSVFFVIMLMFVFLFRSLRLALIALAPNVLAAGIVLGTMGWSGTPLDIMTITITAITIGIAVDNTIHYIIRFRREFAGKKSYSQTIDLCHGSIGRAMYYTSSIIIVGFAVLSLSNFMPTVYFGLLTALAMFSALLGALLLLPSLLLFIKPLGKETAL